ncbi:hypothetical protein DPMN_021650 [Dreissena polymorpha]|uniref:C2H2-type domain-containing protein n=1 Tax=Dreissena polymorpha TaxID=45954 RepID=A0A9D4NPI6_DREPO|nr:hypothetical protein DPMN_021650 [Dreissena polymorpha]
MAPCPVCFKAFRSQWALQMHSRSHTGERPYVCLRCERTFTQKHHMKKHEAIKKALANSADPDEMPHDAVSPLGLRCLLKGISVFELTSQEAEHEKETDQPKQAYVNSQETISPYVSPGNNPSVLSSNKATLSAEFRSAKQEPLDDSNESGGKSVTCGRVKSKIDNDSNESGGESVTCGRVKSEIDETVDADTNVRVKTEVLGETDTSVQFEVDNSSRDGGTYVPMGMNFDPTCSTGSQTDMTTKQGYSK